MNKSRRKRFLYGLVALVLTICQLVEITWATQVEFPSVSENNEITIQELGGEGTIRVYDAVGNYVTLSVGPQVINLRKDSTENGTSTWILYVKDECADGIESIRTATDGSGTISGITYLNNGDWTTPDGVVPLGEDKTAKIKFSLEDNVSDIYIYIITCKMKIIYIHMLK